MRTSIKTIENNFNLNRRKEKKHPSPVCDWLLETQKKRMYYESPYSLVSCHSEKETQRWRPEARDELHTSFSNILAISPRVRSKAETLVFAHGPLSCTWCCFRRSLANRWSLQYKMQWKGMNEREWHYDSDIMFHIFLNILKQKVLPLLHEKLTHEHQKWGKNPTPKASTAFYSQTTT